MGGSMDNNSTNNFSIALLLLDEIDLSQIFKHAQ